MALHLHTLSFDAKDAPALARFWAGVLRRDLVDDPDGGLALLPDDGHVVLADPEGNEFCVIEPGNDFLAGCGFIGALASDGSQQVGYFWSQALGWPPDQQAEVERLVSLGARPIDIGQGDVSWVVLADPDGNEFCVLIPRWPAWMQDISPVGT